jgi:hypothetical protein
MSEEDLLNLQHQVQHHEGELTQLVDRITQLQKDLEIAIRFSIPNVVAQASQYGRGRGSQSSWVILQLQLMT